MNKCVFLDRDGNISVEKGAYVDTNKLEFIEGSIEAIKIFNELGYLVVIVTNQSGIGRHYFEYEDVKKFNCYLINQVKKSGGNIDDDFICPHNPDEETCICRKPNSGMFLEAKEKYDIDFEESIIVGDKCSDINAGLNLNMRSVLVRTGYGVEEEKKLIDNIERYETLYDFALSLKKVKGLE